MDGRYRYYTSDESWKGKSIDGVQLRTNAGRPRVLGLMGKNRWRGTELQNRVLAFLVPGRSLRLELHRHYVAWGPGRMA